MTSLFDYSRIKKDDTIVVWFSCGAASAVAAYYIIKKYSNYCNIRIVNNPIAEEHIDNTRFLRDVEKWLNVKIEFATNPNFTDNSIQSVWTKKKFISDNKGGASCTLLLKKRSRQIWENNNQFQFLVMGFTAEEKHRAERFILEERENMIPILIDEGITKADCYKILKDNGLKLPKIYDLGFPNANCIGCCKATSPTYWNLVREKFPIDFNKRSEISRSLNVKLVRYKGKRIFLDELPIDAQGRKLKSMDIECGIFCEDRRKNRFQVKKSQKPAQIDKIQEIPSDLLIRQFPTSKGEQ